MLPQVSDSESAMDEVAETLVDAPVTVDNGPADQDLGDEEVAAFLTKRTLFLGEVSSSQEDEWTDAQPEYHPCAPAPVRKIQNPALPAPPASQETAGQDEALVPAPPSQKPSPSPARPEEPAAPAPATPAVADVASAARAAPSTAKTVPLPSQPSKPPSVLVTPPGRNQPECAAPPPRSVDKPQPSVASALTTPVAASPYVSPTSSCELGGEIKPCERELAEELNLDHEDHGTLHVLMFLLTACLIG